MHFCLLTHLASPHWVFSRQLSSCSSILKSISTHWRLYGTFPHTKILICTNPFLDFDSVDFSPWSSITWLLFFTVSLIISTSLFFHIVLKIRLFSSTKVKFFVDLGYNSVLEPMLQMGKALSSLSAQKGGRKSAFWYFCLSYSYICRTSLYAV